MKRLLWLLFFIPCHIVVSQGGQAGNTPSNEPVAKTNTSSAPVSDSTAASSSNDEPPEGDGSELDGRVQQLDARFWQLEKRLNKSVHASAILEELKQDTLFLIVSIGVFGAAILCLCLTTCVLGCQVIKLQKSDQADVPPVVNDVESVASKRDTTTSTADGYRLSKQETLEKESNDGHYEDCSFSKPVTPKHTEA
ncbi:unnamed protein product, partial [Mesorhabditis spiculigera]